ncbi:MAG TPA: glycosyltransferase family 4 protein [Candidatus Dormibacteraeota bacterium]|nr:glycosyltransferase family 4 protein [Candidatus Dormibacteraeota bacterium]
MKLLLYSHFFVPSVGGVETIVRSLAAGLADLRVQGGGAEFELTLITQTPPGDFDDASLAFRVIRRPSFSELHRLIRSSDVVHVAGAAIPPLALSLLARKPFVVEHHGFQTICPNGQLLIEPAGTPCPGHFMAGRHAECWRCNSAQGWMASRKAWLLTFMRRFLCARASANVTPTRWLGGLVQLPRVTPIPHGLAAAASQMPPATSADPPIIVFQGRLVTTKGVRVLLEAARALYQEKRRFELIIIGDGPERSSLEQFVRDARLEPCVRFTGRLDGADLEAAFARCSLVVVPSLGGEVFGLVVAESMQRGLPVIASDIGAFAEVLGNTGATFRTGDAADLAAQIARLLDDPSLAKQLGQNGARRANEFCDRRRMVEDHAAVYRSLRTPAN